MADDLSVSGRLRGFLARQAYRVPGMDELEIRSAAALQLPERREPVPTGLITAMVGFERRYGGLSYPLVVGPSMAYGLDGDATAFPTEHGPAFAGILDGDWSWAVEVLADGRTAIAPGAWPSRIIERSVDQRLEKHALLAMVRGWPHRGYEYFTVTDVPPVVREELLPPPVPEASGPADRWWLDDLTAVQLTLRGWPPGRDHWIARVFVRDGRWMTGQDPIAGSAVGGSEGAAVRGLGGFAPRGGGVRAAFWCELCRRGLPGTDVCVPASS